jgi:hypothetical protein
MFSRQELFEALDGKRLQVLGFPWEIEVFGICETSDRRWVQMAVKELPNRLLTVALSPRDTLQSIATTLSTWIVSHAHVVA